MNEIGSEWISPDYKIMKIINSLGIWGQKPYDESIVKVKLLHHDLIFHKFNDIELIIGRGIGELRRLLDLSICTMHLDEIATFRITLKLIQYTVTMQLIYFDFKGYIYTWRNAEKMRLSYEFKEEGRELFNNNDYVEALYKYTKALKLVLSVHISIDNSADTVDDVNLSDVCELKEVLYNNLATCYFKNDMFEIVIPLCERVLKINSQNIKALYKIGISYKGCKNYEKAEAYLENVLKIEPHNKACERHLLIVRQKIQQGSSSVDGMFKKMIVGSVGK